jgi:predicted dehydrogenase
MACAARGVHVVCEKPIGVNAVEARRMWKAYRDSGLGHFVPLWTRYVALFRRAREVVKAGTLGTVRAFVYRWHNPRPAAMPFTWRDDASLSAGGSIADVGSHAYDTLRWILGEEARRVLAHAEVIAPAKPDLGPIDLEEALALGQSPSSSQAGQCRPGTAYDYASIAMEFPSGIVGTLILSHAPVLRKGLAPELELHGAEASLSVDRLGGELRLHRPHADPETLATVPDEGLGNRFHAYVFPALRERMAGRPSEHPGLDDGYRVQLFTDAAAVSATLGAWIEPAVIDATCEAESKTE